MTEVSLLPMAAEAAGVTFPQLVERLVRAAHRRRK
jgi:D-alanine-D-alanine ligase-like ATP-grasp enzyme